MARTNFEESAWRRVVKLAGIMGCSDREAAGTCLCLWGESQDILQTHGTREQIIDWSHLYTLSDADIELWIDALIRSRIITQDADRYLINGNEHQIESRISNMKKAAKGAQATKEKWDKIKKKKASSMPEAGLGHATGTLGPGPNKAMQGNAIQDNKKEEFSPNDLAELWNLESGPLPKIEKLTDSRKNKARAQIAKHPDPDYWRSIITRFLKSKFCIEQWRPSFDDLLKEDIRIKAIEGKYDDRKPGGQKQINPSPIRYAEFKHETTEPTNAGDPEAAAKVRELVQKSLGYDPKKEGA